MFTRFGILEIVVVIIVVIFVFGPRRVGAFARSIGLTFFHFKKTAEEIKRDLTVDIDPEKKEKDRK
jgi:TatA/E family protein of Tat protein translocase